MKIDRKSVLMVAAGALATITLGYGIQSYKAMSHQGITEADTFVSGFIKGFRKGYEKEFAKAQEKALSNSALAELNLLSEAVNIQKVNAQPVQVEDEEEDFDPTEGLRFWNGSQWLKPEHRKNFHVEVIFGQEPCPKQLAVTSWVRHYLYGNPDHYKQATVSVVQKAGSTWPLVTQQEGCYLEHEGRLRVITSFEGATPDDTKAELSIKALSDMPTSPKLPFN